MAFQSSKNYNITIIILAAIVGQALVHGKEYTTSVKNSKYSGEVQEKTAASSSQKESEEKARLIEEQLRSIFQAEKPYIKDDELHVVKENLAFLKDVLEEARETEQAVQPAVTGSQRSGLYKKDLQKFYSPVNSKHVAGENSHGTNEEDLVVENFPAPVDGRYGYLNEWVVHLEGGPELAARVLKDLGYHTHGLVRGFKDLYRVARNGHPRLHKREAEELTWQLQSHSQVVWAEQQQSKIREKKSYLDFMDPDSDRPLRRVKRRVADGNGVHFMNEIASLEKTLLEYPEKIHYPAASRADQEDGREKKQLLERIARFPSTSRSKNMRGELSDVFNDELVENQWYLYDSRVKASLPRLDLGVVEAWQRGFTGEGVRVMILDDGLDHQHQDLRDNYDPTISYDFNDDDADPYPRFAADVVNSHGTKCAGEVAMAANNAKCGVGVAFRARIGGIRMLDGHISDRVEGESLSFARDAVDVVSCSWGPSDDGLTVEGPGWLATAALIKGVQEGRGGKGTIFIWASGNGGMTDDNCNADGYASSVYTAAVTSASQSNKFPWYGERCASTLTSVYSSGAYMDQKIISTDLNNTCTTTFSGTSAAAPLAAGIVALALEANGNLTWRDVQHLTVLSSNYDTLSDNEGWQQNALGFFFNLRFGFGLLDAEKMVTYALNWTTVPEKVVRSVNATQQLRSPWPLPLSAATEARLEFEVTDDAMDGGLFLEHVEAVVTISAPVRGALNIQLHSPRGTRTTLLTPRDKDTSSAGFLSWPFMSVHTWGEDPRGTWVLTIVDNSQSGSSGAVSEATLVLHAATAVPPYASVQYPKQYNLVRSAGTSSSWNKKP